MSNWKIAGITIGSIAALIVLAFIMELTGLGFMKFFEPKKENIRREIFEETQSYVHGKIQDLAKYKKEYDEAESGDKDTIGATIRIRYAEFDEQKIKSTGLRNFLVSVRGY